MSAGKTAGGGEEEKVSLNSKSRRRPQTSSKERASGLELIAAAIGSKLDPRLCKVQRIRSYRSTGRLALLNAKARDLD